MNNEKYYGCENPEAISYLEFGSINLIKSKKDIWGYWQDQEAYDLYMFARYARDLLLFRKYALGGYYNVDEFYKYVTISAHNKLMDYILKYAGMLVIKEKGLVCESGSSLWGWIEEAIACDYTFQNGTNIEKIRKFHYIGSDISEMMNDGAKAFHPDFRMDFSTEYTLDAVVDDICNRISDRLALFYGLSVSIRYAIREAKDLVKIAEKSDISVYNRLSLSLGDTMMSVYGTGKTVYIISLPELVSLLSKKGYKAKYCTANMQREKDGKETVRVSVIISENTKMLDKFIEIYSECIDKSLCIQGVEQGEWKDIKYLK